MHAAGHVAAYVWEEACEVYAGWVWGACGSACGSAYAAHVGVLAAVHVAVHVVVHAAVHVAVHVVVLVRPPAASLQFLRQISFLPPPIGAYWA